MLASTSESCDDYSNLCISYRLLHKLLPELIEFKQRHLLSLTASMGPELRRVLLSCSG